MAQEWPFKEGNGGLDLRCLRTSFAWIRHLRHHCADYAVNPPKQYRILSVDAGSLSRRNTGGATTRWDYKFTASYAESMG